MVTVRRFILVALSAALVAVAPFSPARAATPLRSGTIVSGTGESPASPWVRGMEGCVGAPACSAWLQSGCHPGLAGRNPSVHASIVDVGKLADTDRVLRAQGGVPINWGRFVVQFWTGTEDLGSAGVWCQEIVGARVSSWQCAPRYAISPCTLRIPRNAKWMTISSSPDNMNINWNLW